MAMHWKSILAALAGAAAISAGAASPYGVYEPYDNACSYSYDRYGNAYKRPGCYERYYGGPVLVEPAPILDPSLSHWAWDVPEYYNPEIAREREWRREYERARRGEFDGPSSPHPLSKHYSPG